MGTKLVCFWQRSQRNPVEIKEQDSFITPPPHHSSPRSGTNELMLGPNPLCFAYMSAAHADRIIAFTKNFGTEEVVMILP